MKTEHESATDIRWADRVEIRELLSRYCQAVDRRNPDGLRAVFHPDAEIDKGSGPLRCDDYIADVMRRHAKIPMASHQITNVIVDPIDDDTAWVESYGIALERRAEPAGDHTVRVRYGDLMVRLDGSWRVLSRRIVIDHVASAPALQSTISTEGRFLGSRDGDDPNLRKREEVIRGARTHF